MKTDTVLTEAEDGVGHQGWSGALKTAEVSKEPAE